MRDEDEDEDEDDRRRTSQGSRAVISTRVRGARRPTSDRDNVEGGGLELELELKLELIV